MVILGIDPGTATTGYGLIEKNSDVISHLKHGIISTKPQTNAGPRLLQIFQELQRLIKKSQPDLIAVEKLFFFKNLKTALPVSEARGVILLSAAQQKKPVIELTPLQVKMGICGYGRADKKQVQKMVREILKLKKIPKPDDAADALAVALCAAYCFRQ